MQHDAQKPEAFNVAAGLKVQREQLAIWKSRLNPDCYGQLEAFARMKNESLEGGDIAGFTGYDVARGGDLDNFVHNWHQDKTDDATRNDLISLVRHNLSLGCNVSPFMPAVLEHVSGLESIRNELVAELREVSAQYNALLLAYGKPFGWGFLATQKARELIAQIEGKPTEETPSFPPVPVVPTIEELQARAEKLGAHFVPDSRPGCFNYYDRNGAHAWCVHLRELADVIASDENSRAAG